MIVFKNQWLEVGPTPIIARSQIGTPCGPLYWPSTTNPPAIKFPKIDLRSWRCSKIIFFCESSLTFSNSQAQAIGTGNSQVFKGNSPSTGVNLFFNRIHLKLNEFRHLDHATEVFFVRLERPTVRQAWHRLEHRSPIKWFEKQLISIRIRNAWWPLDTMERKFRFILCTKTFGTPGIYIMHDFA